MSYTALARKWRPRSFAEMTGQEHVLRALGNALSGNRVHHAFLFAGTRGVGKTTVARILAKCLNCETGVTATPCLECASCREIEAGRSIDLIEVDAASRTKVDDTRELLDNVQYAPTRSRYKVYLIDEVHMLTASSFNALLKTLEEPPPHVKFLFATTDPQKLPVTVLSRCLQFNLKRLPVPLIAARLAYILGEEKLAHEPAALQLLAQAADGSMRDALSLLDQLLAFGDGAAREAEARAMLGTVTRDHVERLLRLLAAGDGAALLAVAAELDELAPDYGQVLDSMAALFERLALHQLVPGYAGDEQFAAGLVAELAAAISREDVQLWYQTAIIGRRDLALAPEPRVGFRMTLLRMLAFRPEGVVRGAAGTGGGVATSGAPTRAPAATATAASAGPVSAATPAIPIAPAIAATPGQGASAVPAEPAAVAIPAGEGWVEMIAALHCALVWLLDWPAASTTLGAGVVQPRFNPASEESLHDGLAVMGGGVATFSYRTGATNAIILTALLAIVVGELAIHLTRVQVHPKPVGAARAARPWVRLIQDFTYKRQVASVLADTVMIVVARHLAWRLYLASSDLSEPVPILPSLPLLLVCHLVALLAFRTYQASWRFTGMSDLLRLVVSAKLAGRAEHLAVKLDEACDAVLTGYREGLQAGGRPFVLSEQHAWLREIATNSLRDPVKFWRKMAALPLVQGTVPQDVTKALVQVMPEAGLSYGLRRRVSGLGSLGRPRFVALAEWRGGKVAREAKRLIASAGLWAQGQKGGGTLLYQSMLEQSVRCRDPFVRMEGQWLLRRLSPYCSRIEVTALPRKRDEGKLLYAMGWETANVHLGDRQHIKVVQRDLAARKSTWLRKAAKAMVKATLADWHAWAEHHAG